MQNVSFLFEEEYNQIHNVFAAFYKFLHISPTRVKNRELIKENGRTRVCFCLLDDYTNSSFSQSVIKSLKDLIETDSFVIYDQNLNKSFKAVKNSVILGPKGENVNFKLEKQTDTFYGDVLVGEFRPLQIGRYRIDVENSASSNKPIPNSPYFIHVFNPNLVEINKMPARFIVGNEHLIEISTQKAGHAQLDILIESPSGVQLPFKIDNDLNKKIKFIPREKGMHKILLKYGDFILNNDSEFFIDAFESQIPNFFGNGLYYGLENETTSFYVYAPKYLDGNLSIEIIDSKKNSIKANIEKLTETLYEIKYLPVETGFLSIIIKYNEAEVPNSPFQVRILKPNKVRLLNEHCQLLTNVSKLNDFEVNQEKNFFFDTTEAGPGKSFQESLNFFDLNNIYILLKIKGQLIVDILNPNNEKLPFKLYRENHLQKLSFTPFMEGNFALFKKFLIR